MLQLSGFIRDPDFAVGVAPQLTGFLQFFRPSGCILLLRLGNESYIRHIGETGQDEIVVGVAIRGQYFVRDFYSGHPQRTLATTYTRVLASGRQALHQQLGPQAEATLECFARQEPVPPPGPEIGQAVFVSVYVEDLVPQRAHV